MIKKLFLAIASTTFLLALTTVAHADAVSIISSNFNGTAINPGSTIWFNSHMKVSGLNANTSTTINLTNVTVAFGGQTYTVPNAAIVFSPNVNTATTTFDAANNQWVSTVPVSQAGSDVFMAGLGLLMPNGLAGGQNPVVMQATFSSTAAVSIDWQWGAAVYTQFSTDYNALGVLTVDGGRQSGTPVNFEGFVTGGARGGGGSNFTGSNSATGHVTLPGQAVPEPTTILLLGSGLAGLATRFRKRRSQTE